MRPEAWIVILAILSGCAGPQAAPEPVDAVGRLEGVVLDPGLRPVTGAHIHVPGIGNATSDEDGRFVVEATWNGTEILAVVRAEGFQPATIRMATGSPTRQLEAQIILERVPAGGYTDTQQFRGLIACGAIIQVGHDHGGGDPDDDNHISCPTFGDEQQTTHFVPGPDPQDMVIEVVWEANMDTARFITIVLRDDQGDVVAFAEGLSPLRLDVPESLTQQAFAGGRDGVIQLLPGIPEDEPSEVFIGLHLDQRFDVYATTSHGMVLPSQYSVLD